MKNRIITKIKNSLRRIAKFRLENIVLKGGGDISYSQAGEDMILKCIFFSKEKGK